MARTSPDQQNVARGPDIQDFDIIIPLRQANSSMNQGQHDMEIDEDGLESAPDGDPKDTDYTEAGQQGPQKSDKGSHQPSRTTNTRGSRTAWNYPEVAGLSNKTRPELQKIIEELRARLVAERGRSKRLDVQNEKLKKENIARGSNVEAAVKSDAKLQKEFEKLFRHTQNWSDAWSTIQHLAASRVQLSKVVSRLAQEGSASPTTASVLSKAKNLPLYPDLLFNMLLNEFITYAIFKRPFVFLKNKVNDGPNDEIEKSLTWILEKARTVSLSGGNLVEASIFRALGLPFDDKPEQNSGTEDSIIQGMMDSTCEVMKEKFLNEFGPFMRYVHPERDQRQYKKRSSELFKILKEAMRLWSVLGGQNPQMKVMSLEDLCKEAFRLGHDHYVPHRAMRFDEQEDGTNQLNAQQKSWLGEPIDLVIVPAIIRAGTERGTLYEKETVICQAVVCMMDREGVFMSENDAQAINNSTSLEGERTAAVIKDNSGNLKQSSVTKKKPPYGSNAVMPLEQSSVRPAPDQPPPSPAAEVIDLTTSSSNDVEAPSTHSQDIAAIAVASPSVEASGPALDPETCPSSPGQLKRKRCELPEPQSKKQKVQTMDGRNGGSAAHDAAEATPKKSKVIPASRTVSSDPPTNIRAFTSGLGDGPTDDALTNGLTEEKEAVEKEKQFVQTEEGGQGRVDEGRSTTPDRLNTRTTEEDIPTGMEARGVTYGSATYTPSDFSQRKGSWSKPTIRNVDGTDEENRGPSPQIKLEC